MADVRQFSDAEINRLVKFYEQAELEILDRMNRALLRGNKTEYLAQMKKNIEAILQQLRDGNRTWCTEAIPRVYSQGLYSADAMLKDVGASVKAGFGAIHQQAAQVLTENAYQRFEDVSQVIGRQVNDIYRELALENVRGTVVGYDTWKQTARRFREQLAERGVTGFKDRSGRMWNMRTYTEMHARTVCMEAHLQGTANRLVEQGHDLVKVSTHRGACEKCAPWQGKILSITGKTPGYPTLEEAKAAGLFHPNCRHAYGLHIDLDKEIEELETIEAPAGTYTGKDPLAFQGDIYSYDWDMVDDFIKENFGESITRKDVARATGAHGNEKVILNVTRDKTLAFEIEGQDYSCKGFIEPWSGDKHLYIDLMKSEGGGHAARLIGMMSEHLPKLGINKIKLEAAGVKGGWNGYYTWPRLGFNARLGTQLDAEQKAALAKTPFKDATTIHEVMMHPKGAKWWKEHGSTIMCEFDTTPGSVHRQILEGYLKAKGY